MALLGRALIVAGVLVSTAIFWGGNAFDALISVGNNDIILREQIPEGSTFSVMAGKAGIATSTAIEILEKTKKVYNLAQINAGKELVFIFDKDNGNLKEFDYEIDRDEKLVVQNISTTTLAQWEAKKELIEYIIEIAKDRGVIENSLYQTITSSGLDERLALSLAEMFAWQIDFTAQIQKGDSFKVIYEKKYRDGAFSHPGKILAAEFINYGEIFKGFYFSAGGGSSSGGEGNEAKAGYYDENGDSLQKVFLKTPVQYKYISSGFSYSRLNPISQVFTKHRAIDYAAPQGTPVVAVGEGVVTYAGWNGDYGIMVRVRHNEMYTTNYGHFMSIAKGIRSGTRVKQGQIIGYVGSTGQSTGPHLHYEMLRFGSMVNPFLEKIPAGEPVKEVDKSAFEGIKNTYQSQLAELK